MKKYCIFMMLALLYVVGQAQTKVTGVVTSSEDGQTLPGVSVVVKGTDTGVITNIDGNYSIEVPGENPVLVFTFVGMTPQEIPIEGRSKIDVVMNPSIIDLDEVVVIAYGTIKKASFTGSATVVDNEELEKITTPSLNKALLGATPGLQISTSTGQPGSQSTVRIRGTGSLSASSRPLYVVDGIPISTGNYSDVADEDYETSSDVLSSINVADIESISVLKDAAAASMYGSAAANGVIIITTKRGKAGESKINFSAKYGIQSIQKNRYDMMNSDQLYKIYFDAHYAEAIANNAADPVTYANSETATALRHNPYNVDNPLDANGNLVPGATNVVNTNWLDVIFKTALTKDYNIQALGGSEKTNYYASVGYGYHDGIAIASNFEKMTGKLNLSSQMNDYIKIGMENTLGHTIQNTPAGGTGGASIYQMGLLFSNALPRYIVDTDGNPVLDANGKLQYNYNNPVSQEYNPEGLSSMNDYRTKTYRAISSIWTEVEFLKDFKFKSTANVDYIGLTDIRYWNPYYGDGNSVGGRGTRWSKTEVNWTLSNILTYTKEINEHSLTALAGYEAYERNYEFIGTESTGYVTMGDVILPELANASVPVWSTSYTLEQSKVSAFGRLNYDFKDRYYLSASLRSDGSSKFGSKKRYGTFYSVGASWRITEEAFMSNFTSWLTSLKLRTSYGTSGNDAIDNFKFLALYTPYTNNDEPGYIHNQLPNDELHWEANVNMNVGLDISLFNKLSITYEYYNRKSTDLLYQRPLPFSTGFENIETNFASLKNFGHEVEIQANLIATNDLRLDVGLNLTQNTNEIIEIASEEILGSKIYQEGGSIYEYYLKEWAGVDKATGAPLWYKDDENGNKVLTSVWGDADRYNQGTSTPDVFGSFTTDLSYKGFDLSLLLYYSIGGKILDYTEQALFYTGGGNKGHNLTNAIQDYWTPDNPNAKYPRFVIDENLNSYERSTLFLHDATYMQLKSIRLGYSIPTKIIEKAYLSEAKVFVSAENYLTWYKDKDLKVFDPDMGINGYEFFRTPAPKIISFGINIGF